MHQLQPLQITAGHLVPGQHETQEAPLGAQALRAELHLQAVAQRKKGPHGKSAAHAPKHQGKQQRCPQAASQQAKAAKGHAKHQPDQVFLPGAAIGQIQIHPTGGTLQVGHLVQLGFARLHRRRVLDSISHQPLRCLARGVNGHVKVAHKRQGWVAAAFQRQAPGVVVAVGGLRWGQAWGHIQPKAQRNAIALRLHLGHALALPQHVLADLGVVVVVSVGGAAGAVVQTGQRGGKQQPRPIRHGQHRGGAKVPANAAWKRV